MSIKKLLAVTFICTAVFAVGQAFAQDLDDGVDEIGGEEWLNNVPPMSYWGLRGLSQTVSGELLGRGRLNFGIFFSHFGQDQKLAQGGRWHYESGQVVPKSKWSTRVGPSEGSSVTTLMGTASWGVNEIADLYGCLPLIMYSDPLKNNNKIDFSVGELMGGVQFRPIPIPEDYPLRVAGQVSVIYGLTNTNDDDSTVNDRNFGKLGITYGPDYSKDKDKGDPALSYAGYEYGNARVLDQIDLILKLSETVIFHEGSRSSYKLHLNEGATVTPGISDTWLLLLAGGLELGFVEFLTVGLEVNWRTTFSHPSFEDPLWATGSVMYRSPYIAGGILGTSIVGGIDYRLSSAKDVTGYPDGVYPLEQYRVFANLAFSVDYLASKRAEMVRQAKANAAEKARLRKLAALSAAQRDSVERKAREDSLALAAALVAKAEKARQDSIAQAREAAEREAQLMADAEGREAHLKAQSAATEAQLRADAEKKRIADSLALAELNKKLAEERAKRSAMEQQMLSTGMIVLDGVFFVTGKSEIQLNSRGYLTSLAKMLVKYPKLRIEIGGHTDNVGSLQTNMTLSQTRADAVFMFMHNIEPALAQMLSTKGYGPTVPKADNNTAAGREINRRVELKVLNPEVLQEYNP